MKIPKVSKNPDVNWRNDDIQFPRLIAEMEAMGAFQKPLLYDLSASMDLTPNEVLEIVDRAQNKWDKIKEKT